MLEIEKALETQLNKRLLFVFKRVKAYEGVPVVLETGDGLSSDVVCYLDEMSSLVDNLKNIYYRDMMLYVYEVLTREVLDKEIEGKKYSWNGDQLRELGGIVGSEVFNKLQAIDQAKNESLSIPNRTEEAGISFN
jgi:hypothetical protein